MTCPKLLLQPYPLLEVPLIMSYIHVESLVRIISLRDLETEEHSRRVASLALELAHLMDVPTCDLPHIYRGAVLHDIGKICIPDSILRKKAPLTREEQIIMQAHPIYGYEILRSIPFLRPALDIPYCHHEKWDGMGYPRGLIGEQIPFAARLFAVVDVWDALLSDRPYRPAWTMDQACEYILEQSGRHFEPRIVNIFLGKVLLSDNAGIM